MTKPKDLKFNPTIAKALVAITDSVKTADDLLTILSIIDQYLAYLKTNNVLEYDATLTGEPKNYRINH